MPPYKSDGFDPPAPVAVVAVRNPSSQRVVSDIKLLIDTGADLTLIPKKAAALAGVTPIPDALYELVGFDGNRSQAPAVLSDMIFMSRAFRGRYLLIDADVGILGRDVLNLMTLILDGPVLEWTVRT